MHDQYSFLIHCMTKSLSIPVYYQYILYFSEQPILFVKFSSLWWLQPQILYRVMSSFLSKSSLAYNTTQKFKTFTKFQIFDKFSQLLPNFYKYDQISQFWTNFTIPTITARFARNHHSKSVEFQPNSHRFVKIYENLV